MVSLYDFLKTMQEPIPDWLLEFTPGDPFNHDRFFSSRTVFYPGSGTDGHPVKLFGSSHSAHCFIYTDYAHSKEAILSDLESPLYGFRGYSLLDTVELSMHDLVPRGWTPHLSFEETKRSISYIKVDPYGFLAILQRFEDLGDDHGAKRLAILFLGADAIATYDALFCQGGIYVPFCNFVQDHGFGWQYEKFGRGGLLDKLAHKCDRLPNWAVFGENTTAWHDYVLLQEVDGDRGSRFERRIYQLRK